MRIRTVVFGAAVLISSALGSAWAEEFVLPRAEPEPAQPVKACDAYGPGFYQVPGTETCLRVSGVIRYDFEYSSKNDSPRNGAATDNGNAANQPPNGEQ